MKKLITRILLIHTEEEEVWAKNNKQKAYLFATHMEKILKPNKSDIKNDIGNINKKGNEDNISNLLKK